LNKARWNHFKSCSTQKYWQKIIMATNTRSQQKNILSIVELQIIYLLPFFILQIDYNVI
jgi:hypothetical protein